VPAAPAAWVALAESAASVGSAATVVQPEMALPEVSAVSVALPATAVRLATAALAA